jgi:hypothetical protein
MAATPVRIKTRIARTSLPNPSPQTVRGRKGRSLRVEIGPERMVLCDGLQPFLFTTGSGKLVLQAQFHFPPNYIHQERDEYPGLPGTVTSTDNGASWWLWRPQNFLSADPMVIGLKETPQWMKSGASSLGPIFEGTAAQLDDGSIIVVQYGADGPDSRGLWRGKLWVSQDDFNTVTPMPMTVRMPEARNSIGDAGQVWGVRFRRRILPLPGPGAGAGAGGELLMCAYTVFESDKTPNTTLASNTKCRSVLLRSRDKGRSWDYVSTIAQPGDADTEEGFDEPVIARVSRGPREGRLVSLMRTGSFEWPIYQAISDDGGATWSPPRPLPFRGVDPDLIEMADGTLVCACGWRTKLNPDMTVPRNHGYYLSFSFDQGDTWSPIVRFPLEPYSVWRYGTCYGSIAEVEPGVLLFVYDVGSWDWPVRYTASRTIRVTRGRASK